MRLTLCFLTLVALCACNGPTEPLSDSERIALLRARARWNAAGLSSYTFEQRRLCFCPPETGEWARVTVRDGRVVSVVRALDGTPHPHGSRLTVPEIFKILDSARDYDFLSDIEVDFDARYGYPTLIELVNGPDVTDGGLTVQARALVSGL